VQTNNAAHPEMHARADIAVAPIVVQRNPARGGVMSTAVLAAPTPSGKPSHRGSAIPTAASVAPTPSYPSIREADTLAGGGVVPTAALAVPMPKRLYLQ